MPDAATATLTGSLGPGLDAGPIIARIDSYQSIWIGSLQPHLCRHALVQSASSNRDCWRTPCCLWSASIASGSIYDRKRAQMRLHNINCCVSSCTCGMAWPRGQLSTIRIWVPNRGSIRPNTNSPFGQLFGPVRTWIFGTALIQKYGTKTVRYWDYVGNITKKISILLHNLLVAVSKGMQAAKPCYKNFSSS